MFSASRGILYTAPPAEEEPETDRTRPKPNAEADAEEPSVDDTTPAASRANWTGSVPADD